MYLIFWLKIGSGGHPTSYPMGTGTLSPGVKRPEREADNSPPSSAKVKKSVVSYNIDY
jgi:hypothetical protein